MQEWPFFLLSFPSPQHLGVSLQGSSRGIFSLLQLNVKCIKSLQDVADCASAAQGGDLCCGQVSSALCGQMQPGARRLEMFPALPGTSIQGTVPFPFGKDNEGSSLPPPGPPDVAACADRPRCFSAPETLLCSIPARGDRFGQSISKKGPRKAGREGKGFPKSQRPCPGTLSGCFPSRGCVGAGCSPGRTSPDGAGGPRTKQPPLAVRLAFCIPTVLVMQRAKTPALTLPGVRG